MWRNHEQVGQIAIYCSIPFFTAAVVLRRRVPMLLVEALV